MTFWPFLLVGCLVVVAEAQARRNAKPLPLGSVLGVGVMAGHTIMAHGLGGAALLVLCATAGPPRRTTRAAATASARQKPWGRSAGLWRWISMPTVHGRGLPRSVGSEAGRADAALLYLDGLYPAAPATHFPRSPIHERARTCRTRFHDEQDRDGAS